MVPTAKPDRRSQTPRSITSAALPKAWGSGVAVDERLAIREIHAGASAQCQCVFGNTIGNMRFTLASNIYGPTLQELRLTSTELAELHSNGRTVNNGGPDSGHSGLQSTVGK
jgi:hypothetical protein